jgi:hypothetical protein
MTAQFLYMCTAKAKSVSNAPCKSP